MLNKTLLAAKNLIKRINLVIKLLVGLQVNQYFALEAQYTDLGKPKDKISGRIEGMDVTTKGTADTKGFGFNVVGTLPLDNFALNYTLPYLKEKLSLVWMHPV